MIHSVLLYGFSFGLHSTCLKAELSVVYQNKLLKILEVHDLS
jgi:hypothetical protein